MANIEKWRNSQIAGMISYDWTKVKSEDEHPELAGKNKTWVYFTSSKDSQLTVAYLKSWDDSHLLKKVLNGRQQERLKEVYVYNSKDKVDVMSVICHVPPQVPENEQGKFLFGFRKFCEQKFQFKNMLAFIEHYHEHRPHGQAYAL